MSDEKENGNSNGRISISEEKLQLALAAFKLELVKEFERFATNAALEMIDARVKILELWQAGIVSTIRERNDVSRRTIAWAAIVVTLFGTIAALVYQVVTS